MCPPNEHLVISCNAIMMLCNYYLRTTDSVELQIFKYYVFYSSGAIMGLILLGASFIMSFKKYIVMSVINVIFLSFITIGIAVQIGIIFTNKLTVANDF